MQVFRLGKATIICETGSTRNGFKHTATLCIGAYAHCTAKCFYLNRTWEAYQYQDVFHKILDKTDSLSKRQKTLFRKKYDA